LDGSGDTSVRESRACVRGEGAGLRSEDGRRSDGEDASSSGKKAADDEVIENDERSEAEVWQKGKGRDG
jgi:hypothetical protein